MVVRARPKGWFRRLTDSGHADGDSIQLRRQKSIFTGASFLKASMCPLWCTMFIVAGTVTAGLIPLVYATFTGLSIAALAKNKNIERFRVRQTWFIFLAPFGVTIAVGGLHASSAVILWSFLAPLIALLFHGPELAKRWLLGFFVLVVASFLIEVLVLLPVVEISPLMLNVFAAMNVSVVTLIVFTAVLYYASLLDEERAVQEELNRELVAKHTELDEKNQQLAKQKQRISASQTALVQNEKMAALGRLSAGMAHELNNPASAAQRGANHLEQAVSRMRDVCFSLGRAELSEVQTSKLIELEKKARESVRMPAEQDPIDRMDSEAALQGWLNNAGIDSELDSSTLVDIGFTKTELDELLELYGAATLEQVLTRVVQWYVITSLLGEIGHGSNRIIGIVKALKSYSHLDQGSTQSIRLDEGLNNTLVMLHSVLKQGINVVRDYDADLPCISAHGGELNQVWTNLIDNAVQAMEGKGELTVRTLRDADDAVVQIIDNGPGIPDEILERVFDPFVTTKAVGAGTGLGLNISHNIVVKKHAGSIHVDSKPGRTCFEVRLPIKEAECPPES